MTTMMVQTTPTVWKAKVTLRLSRDRENEKSESIMQESTHDLDRHDLYGPLVWPDHEAQSVFRLQRSVLHLFRLDDVLLMGNLDVVDDHLPP
ncbi:hypothetical protein Sjap_026382 [Stephania japonica]|uniref:Uncharacterized protein n=1 Tax=Stephania japonica TaxID=461633 RepID=A0AAP0E3L2_9MAGN